MNNVSLTRGFGGLSWALRAEDVRLFFLSAMVLYLEVALIRYVGTEARIFAYLSNIVLLACFLGFGFGCYFAKKTIHLFLTPVLVGVLLCSLHLPLTVSVSGERFRVFRDAPQMMGAFNDFVIWGQVTQPASLVKITIGFLSIAFLICLLVGTFIPIGQIMGRFLNTHPRPMVAYSINVMGSLVGLWVLGLFSSMHAPPWIWFSLVFLLSLIDLKRNRSWLAGLGLVLCFFGIVMTIPYKSVAKEVVWSPYQKLSVFLYSHIKGKPEYVVGVNNTGYMLLLDLSDTALASIKRPEGPVARHEVQYDMPFLLYPNPNRVLIVGAGGGNDAAGALRNGAQKVLAVEIDPGVVDIGRRYHPEAPYNDPRVNVIIDDARSFMHKDRETYDVVLFGLLDAHTSASSFNNTRVDHYVYTKEAFEEARRRLGQDGILVVKFSAQWPWIADRLKRTLVEVFGHAPLAFRMPQDEFLGWGGVFYAIGHQEGDVEARLAKHPLFQDYVNHRKVTLPARTFVTTDNWPYLYLKEKTIPKLYLAVSLMVLGIFLGLRKKIGGTGERINWHFFFLGAGFLLIEFHNISKSVLLFGSTWLVNSITLSSILALILLANWTAANVPRLSVSGCYFGVLISLFLAFFLPLDYFQTLPFVPKAVFSGLMLNAPLFFSGIIFVRSFAQADQKDVAFGSNLFGAVVGGLLESLSFVIGIKAVLIVVAVLYVASAAPLFPINRLLRTK